MPPSQRQSLHLANCFIHSNRSALSNQSASRPSRSYKPGYACSFHHVTSHEKDWRSRLSRLWAPSGGIATSVNEGVVDSALQEMTRFTKPPVQDAHSKLLRAGFLRQAHPGIFHMLPLGYRVQEKVERLIDRHMHSLGASRLDLSSISSEDLWITSGRFEKVNSELFLFRDRKDSGYLLSPTHEEEITSLIACTVRSYRELPTRLYQISRKYRDELRPRHGLLRSREFIMKDLYTFDSTKSLALTTYEMVRNAYSALFNELKIPYLVAEADSGDMGGNLSHEYHFLTPKGEDQIISCKNCGYVANEELAKAAMPVNVQPEVGIKWSFRESNLPLPLVSPSADKAFSVWRGVSRDRTTLINVWYPLPTSSSIHTVQPEINTYAVKRLIPDLDSGAENAAALWRPENQITHESGANQVPGEKRIVNLIDYRLSGEVSEYVHTMSPSIPIWPEYVDEDGAKAKLFALSKDPLTHEHLDLLRIQNGDKCPKCREGELNTHVAIELGHTFFLGTRYSEPFNATVRLPLEHPREDVHMGRSSTETQQSSRQVPMQMGCHGIGVSRMIGAVAETLADEKGLNWPRVIAPYEVVIVPTKGNEQGAVFVYDTLVGGLGNAGNNTQKSLDVVLDDRAYQFPWKMKDADLIGYPVIVVVGKGWQTEKICEVQCRRLGICEQVPFERLHSFVQDELLVRL